MRLSCCEIRRLLWQLVVVVERSAALVLRWSWWRRWHQAWAHYYHHRRQERTLSEPVLEQAQRVSELTPAEPPGEIEIVWKRLEPLLPPEKRTGRPYEYARRLVLQAIVHLMRTNCGWRYLPTEFPPWQTVYAQLSQWRKTGIWDTIWAGLEQPKPLPDQELQL